MFFFLKDPLSEILALRSGMNFFFFCCHPDAGLRIRKAIPYSKKMLASEKFALTTNLRSLHYEFLLVVTRMAFSLFEK